MGLFLAYASVIEELVYMTTTIINGRKTELIRPCDRWSEGDPEAEMPVALELVVNSRGQKYPSAWWHQAIADDWAQTLR